MERLERRKSKLSKVSTQFDALMDERLAVEDTLRLLFDQIYSYVDYAKNRENVEQKDMTDILKYELKILKKLIEMNSDLENFIDEKHIDVHVQNGVFNYANDPVENNTESCNSIVGESAVKPETSILQQSEPLISVSSATDYFPIKNDEFITPFEFPEISSRNSLNNFSAKLGLNEHSFSKMEDYYEKPSTSCMSEHADLSIKSVPNPEDNSEIPLTNYNGEGYTDLSTKSIPISEVTSDIPANITNFQGFEIPVKDTNFPFNKLYSGGECMSGCAESISEAFKIAESSTRSFVDQPETGELLCQNYLYNCDSGNENIKKVSNQEETNQHSFTFQTAPEVLENQYGFKSFDTCDNICEKSQNTSVTVVENSSALLKLNNYQTKLPNDGKDDEMFVPDISLKPTKIENTLCVKNFNTKNSPKLKGNRVKQDTRNVNSKIGAQSKENRKKEQRMRSREQEDSFLELKHKMPPRVGDECAFSHIESPSEFYVHIRDEETALIDSLTEQTNEYFNGTVSTYDNKQMAYTDIGKFCFAFIHDYQGWFRAEVLDWNMNELEDVLIQLVDYGNKRIISCKNLRKMIKELCDIPMLATRCHFPLMYPAGSTCSNKLIEWSEIAVEALISLTANGAENIFKIVYAQKKTNSMAIDLISACEENEHNTLGQILLDVGFAVQIFDD